MMVALCVALSFAVLPILYQQAMAAHHAMDTSDAHGMSSGLTGDKAVKSCEKQPAQNPGKGEMSCCDISCSSVVAFETMMTPLFANPDSEHTELEADELYSRVGFGLKRPPRI